MNADLRFCTAIALLAMCGCASTGAAEPVRSHRDATNALPLAEPDGGGGLHGAAMADASGARSATDVARPAGNAVTESAEDITPVAGERRAASGRHLSLRQKRIFVLGLAAQGNK